MGMRLKFSPKGPANLSEVSLASPAGELHVSTLLVCNRFNMAESGDWLVCALLSAIFAAAIAVWPRLEYRESTLTWLP